MEIGPNEIESSRMPIWQHLDELRNGLIRSIIAIFVGFCVTYYFSEILVHFLEKPLLVVLPPSNQHLFFTGVADKFFIYLKVAFIAAVGLTSPYLFYQVWLFISPALHKSERRFAMPFVLFACLTFLCGLAFTYYLVIPFGYKFLIHFGSPDELPIITLNDYFGLTLKLLLCMGLIFEVPVLLVLLAKFGLVRAETLTRYRRHALVVNAIIAAVATPTPDAFTMLLVMVPLCLLYEIGIIGVRLVTRVPQTHVA